MKFILIIDRIATGGAERILVDYYHHLDACGHEPYVFVLVGNPSQSKWTEGLRVEYGAPYDEKNLLKKSAQQLRLLLKLRKLVKRVKPSGMFSFLEKSNLITILTPAAEVKKAVSVHNVLSIQYTKIRSIVIRRLVGLILRFAYNRCEDVIAVSKQVKDDLTHSFKVCPENIAVVNNYVDRELVKRKSLEPLEDFVFKNDVKYILNVGRFSDQKAQWKLVKAFYVYEKNTDEKVELILMGAGDCEKNLKDLVQGLRIADKVHILPFNLNPYKYMSKVHLFVLSSIFEGFPIVLAEISSLRIPFVGSKKSIPEELFSDKSVWEEAVFDCECLNKDFSGKIYEDELALAKLLKKGVECESFRKKILFHSQQWENGNDKENQFSQYDSIMLSKAADCTGKGKI